MEDFNALAAALGAGIADIRGCLILSRDGLVLGGHPEDAEAATKAAWLRFAGLGEPERGFVQHGIETWSYVRRGAYSAFAVTGPGVRPGLVIDQIEQVLLAAEEARSRREGLRSAPPQSPPGPALAAPVAAQTPASPTRGKKKKKKRAILHRDQAPMEHPVVIHAEPPGAPATADPGAAPPSEPGDAADAVTEAPALGSTPSDGEEPDSPDRASGVWATGEEAEDVDRFSLAREFSQLLQDDPDDADA